jgi:hypothetical protein
MSPMMMSIYFDNNLLFVSHLNYLMSPILTLIYYMSPMMMLIYLIIIYYLSPI